MSYPTVPKPGQSHFDLDQPHVDHLRRLNELRRELPALRRGRTEIRWEKWHEPGLFAFARKLDAGDERGAQGVEAEVIVAINPYGETMRAHHFVRPPDLRVPRAPCSSACCGRASALCWHR